MKTRMSLSTRFILQTGLIVGSVASASLTDVFAGEKNPPPATRPATTQSSTDPQRAVIMHVVLAQGDKLENYNAQLKSLREILKPHNIQPRIVSEVSREKTHIVVNVGIANADGSLSAQDYPLHCDDLNQLNRKLAPQIIRAYDDLKSNSVDGYYARRRGMPIDRYAEMMASAAPSARPTTQPTEQPAPQTILTAAEP